MSRIGQRPCSETLSALISGAVATEKSKIDTSSVTVGSRQFEKPPRRLAAQYGGGVALRVRRGRRISFPHSAGRLVDHDAGHRRVVVGRVGMVGRRRESVADAPGIRNAVAGIIVADIAGIGRYGLDRARAPFASGAGGRAGGAASERPQCVTARIGAAARARAAPRPAGPTAAEAADATRSCAAGSATAGSLAPGSAAASSASAGSGATDSAAAASAASVGPGATSSAAAASGMTRAAAARRAADRRSTRPAATAACRIAAVTRSDSVLRARRNGENQSQRQPPDDWTAHLEQIRHETPQTHRGYVLFGRRAPLVASQSQISPPSSPSHPLFCRRNIRPPRAACQAPQGGGFVVSRARPRVTMLAWDACLPCCS